MVIISGGGAGLGSWAFQDDPRLLALWTLVTGKPADGDKTQLDGSLVTEVVDAFKPRDAFRQPGALPGHHRQGPARPKTLQAGAYRQHPGQGEETRPARPRYRRSGMPRRMDSGWPSWARTNSTAGWPHRPFQVEWNPGDQFVLEVYDAKTGLFIPPTRFTLAQADSSANEFPLKSGDFPLEPVTKLGFAGRSAHEPRRSPKRAHRRSSFCRPSPTQVAERPIVIK